MIMMLKRGGPGETDKSPVLLKTLFSFSITTLLFSSVVDKPRTVSGHQFPDGDVHGCNIQSIP